MRRFTVLIYLASLAVALSLTSYVTAADWTVVTYNNSERSNNNPLQELYDVLANPALVSGDRILVADHLDTQLFDGTANGVNSYRGILIDHTSLTFLNPMTDGNARRIIASTPSNVYPLFDVTWQNAGGINVGHLRFSEPTATADTTFNIRNGRRLASDLGQIGDSDIEGYLGASQTNVKTGVNGGGGMRVVGYNNNITGTNAIARAGVNFGTSVEFGQNTADYGGALFVKNYADRGDISLWNWVTFEKRAYFLDNTALHDGGGIYATEGASIKFFNANEYENYLNGGYGGFAHRTGTSYGGGFSRNIANNSGGGIAMSSNAYMEMFGGGTFIENEARGTVAVADYEFSGEGGAIFMRDNSQMFIYNGASFQNNTSQGAGGAISIRNNAQMLIEGRISFEGNYARGSEDVRHRNGANVVGQPPLYPGYGTSTDPGFGVRPAAGYGGAIHIDGGTLTLYRTSGNIGGMLSNGTMLTNTHGVDKTPNGIFMNTNAQLNIMPGAGGVLNIYDPIASRGLEQTTPPTNEVWTLNGGYTTHGNAITINGHHTGVVNIWGDSSDSAFMAPNSDYTNRYTGGQNTTYVDGDDYYHITNFSIGSNTVYYNGAPGGYNGVNVNGFDLNANAATGAGSNMLIQLNTPQTLNYIAPSAVREYVSDGNTYYAVTIDGYTYHLPASRVSKFPAPPTTPDPSYAPDYYSVTLNEYNLSADYMQFLAGDQAYGYYGDTNVFSGTFVLRDGATQPIPANQAPVPTEYGSNRRHSWLQGNIVRTTTSGTLTIGNAGGDPPQVNAPGIDEDELLGSDGSLILDPALQPTVVLEKFTGNDTEYTTLRANEIVMRGGVIKMTGYKPNGELSPTGEIVDGVNRDTAKIYLGNSTYTIRDTDGDRNGVYAGGDGAITVYAPDRFTGAGYGGTFDIGDGQEYTMVVKLTGAGNFTKAGNGLLIFDYSDLITGDYYVHQAWRPNGENDILINSLIRQPPAKSHEGLTIVSGGTLRTGGQNSLAHVKLYGLCDPDSPNVGTPHPTGENWHNIRPDSWVPTPNNPLDRWYSTGDGGQVIKKDYRDRLIFQGISRGVVLTGQTGTVDASGFNATLDLRNTTELVVHNTPEYNRTDEYVWDDATSQMIKNERYIAQVKEQTIGALAGIATSQVQLGSDIILTISDGWIDASGEPNKDFINTNFTDVDFFNGSQFDRYFSGQITGGGKLVKRGAGYLGLSGVNQLDKSTELQGGGLYIGNRESIGIYNEAVNRGDKAGIGLVEVFGEEDKVFGIRNDADYTLTLRFQADAEYIPDDPAGSYDPFTNVRRSWLDRPAGDLTFDANGRTLTFADVQSTRNGGVIEMIAGSADRPWEKGADLYFDSETEGSAYIFRNNHSSGKGGAIYAGGNLTIVGNTLFDQNDNASGAIHVAGGNSADPQAYTQTLFDTSNGDIAFKSNNTFSITFAKNTRFLIQGNNNVYFDAPISIENQNENGNNVSLTKEGDGFIQLKSNNSFNGEVLVRGGTLRLAGAGTVLGNCSQFNVIQYRDPQDPTKLLSEGGVAGAGTIRAKSMNITGRISPDNAILKIPDGPNGVSILDGTVKPTIPVADKIGSMKFVSPTISFSGTYTVDLGYSRLQGNISDQLIVEGDMKIENDAQLEIDPSSMNLASVYTKGARYIIIDSNQKIRGTKFKDKNITYLTQLPRFIKMLSHGFTASETEYYLQYGASGWTFTDPANTRNQHQVANMLNGLLGTLEGLPDKYTTLLFDIATLDDVGVREALEQISPDIRASSMELAISDAWRSPFRRMRHRDPGYRPQTEYRGQARVPLKVRPRELWVDFYHRSTDTYGDSNARTYGISRTGFMIGLEKELHDDITVGAVFGYASPYLYQSSGRVETDDFQGGVYTHIYLPNRVELRGYIGMSGLNYDYTRKEMFPTSNGGRPQMNKYTANFNGQALAFSAEVSRPLRWSSCLLFLPIAGIDHQLSHQDAFTETGGPYNQRFDKGEFSRTIARIGLNTQIGEKEDFLLHTRLQYGIRLEDSAPTSNSQFADLPGAPPMMIEGIVLGSNYVNLGIGCNFFLNQKGTMRMFFDYDADITERSIVNTGNVGLTTQW